MVILQRVIPNCADVFSTLNDAINKFWPAVFLGSTSATEMSLFSLPTISMHGGLGVRNPVDSAPLLYTASV